MSELSPDQNIRGTPRIGMLRNEHGNFRQLVLLLAEDPAYATAPIKHLALLHQWLSAGRVMVAMDGDEVVGATAWTMINSQEARESIAARALPKAGIVFEAGDEVLITFVTGQTHQIMRHLMRRLITLQRGRLILFERHHIRGQASRKFGWFDRSGVRGGPHTD